MARSLAQWAEARALFEQGNSLREISDKVGIEYSVIGKRARKEKWESGFLPEIATAKARNLIDKKNIEKKIATLLPQSREIVEREVMTQLELANYFEHKGKEVIEIAMEALKKDPSASAAKATMETLKTGMVVTGAAAYHANAANITNVNAQQNNPIAELISTLHQTAKSLPANGDY